jgi:GGDEF domain-containing protein
MTTLAPFMNASRTVAAERKAEALSRVVSLLLQGIALHSFETGSAQAASFQTGIRKVRADFDKTDDPDSVLLLAGAAIHLMEEFNDAARQQARARQNEFESAIALLTEALLEVARTDAETLVAFKEIERDLASAPGVEGLRSAREKLTHAVEAVRDEVSNPLGKCGIPRGDVDSSTGLPDYGFAAGAIADIWHCRDDYYAAIFAAERLETINLRFGFQAGDQVLQVLSDHVMKLLGRDDKLFRWRGPCIMALLRRGVSEAQLAADLSRQSPARMEHALTLGDREVILTLSTSWNLFPLNAFNGIDELLGQMNTFAAGRLSAKKDTSASKARA